MSRIFKIFSLLIYVVFISSFGNAALMGGHDRQRLLLIFANVLQQHFVQTPIEINAQIFPVRLLETSTNKASYDIFNVLTEEGALVRRFHMENLSEFGVDMNRVVSFENPGGVSHPAFILGFVEVQRITGIERNTESSHLSYEVNFLWQLTQPAQWLWAPDLDNNSRIQTLKMATDSQKNAQASISWINNRWHVESVSELY